MNLSLTLACAWVVVACIAAMFPSRRAHWPLAYVLIAAPVLIVWLGVTYGWLAGLGALAAFVSMFRNPLRYFWQKWRGKSPEIPQ